MIIKKPLIIEDGSSVQAISPVVVSASRCTDIPAFYADWFFHRLQVGYSVWTNPFNGKKSYVSYDATRFIVFWSKNPLPLLPFLDILRKKNIGCYIQFTLNDYEDENLEPYVPSLLQRIETFIELSKCLGKEAVIWRFDPLVLTETLTVEKLLSKIERIAERLHGFTNKLVFSYADIASYRKVRANLLASGIPYREWDEGLMDKFAYGLYELNSKRGWNFELATCGENINLSKIGINRNSCIDAKLIARLAFQDEDLMKYLPVRILEPADSGLFGEQFLPDKSFLLPDGRRFICSQKKDPGQRKSCGCMTSKDIGEYNTCPHSCVYCYANSSKETAIQNWRLHNANRLTPTITGK